MTTNLFGHIREYDSMAYNGLPYSGKRARGRSPHHSTIPPKPSYADAVFDYLRAHPEGVRARELTKTAGLKSDANIDIMIEYLLPWGVIYDEKKEGKNLFFLDAQ